MKVEGETGRGGDREEGRFVICEFVSMCLEDGEVELMLRRVTRCLTLSGAQCLKVPLSLERQTLREYLQVELWGSTYGVSQVEDMLQTGIS